MITLRVTVIILEIYNMTDTYIMLYCSIDNKQTAHKIEWHAELQGLKIKYYPTFLCGTCQRGLLHAINTGNSNYQLNKHHEIQSKTGS